HLIFQCVHFAPIFEIDVVDGEPLGGGHPVLSCRFLFYRGWTRPPGLILRSMELTVLYRPVGRREYELVEATGFRRFPPRLPEQPFFYPVTNEDYATQIARDWNTKDEESGWTGYVLRFQVQSEFLRKYPVRTVGSAVHKEYWIPAAELEEFNDHLEGVIDSI